MEMPVGLCAVAQTGGRGGAVTAGATCDRGLTGKHRVPTPASNLLVINQTEGMPHRPAARFRARGAL